MRNASTQQHGLTQGGFTFIELTVVIVIMMAVAAIGVPNLLSWVNESNLGAASRRLSGMIRYVRNEAARRQKTFYLTIDLDNHAYWMETKRDPKDIETPAYYTSSSSPEDEDYELFEDEFVARQELRKRVVFDSVVYADLMPEDYGKVRIAFRPDGTTETVAIYLKNTQEMEATVMLDGDTGRMYVYDYRVEPEPPLVLYEQYDLDE